MPKVDERECAYDGWPGLPSACRKGLVTQSCLQLVVPAAPFGMPKVEPALRDAVRNVFLELFGTPKAKLGGPSAMNGRFGMPKAGPRGTRRPSTPFVRRNVRPAEAVFGGDR